MGKALILLLAALPALAQNPVQQALAPAVQQASDAYDNLAAAYKAQGARLTTANSIITSLSAALAVQNARVADLTAQLASFAGAVGVIRLDPVTVVAMCKDGQTVDARGGCG